MQFNVLRKWEFFYFPLSIAFLNQKILDFLFLRKIAYNMGSEMRKILVQETVGNFLGKLWKLYMNGTEI